LTASSTATVPELNTRVIAAAALGKTAKAE
jgi:hypothetical protein